MESVLLLFILLVLVYCASSLRTIKSELACLHKDYDLVSEAHAVRREMEKMERVKNELLAANRATPGKSN